MLTYIPMPFFNRTKIMAFWSRLDRTGGRDSCWHWIGSTDPHGYGKLKISGTTYRSHRVAYYLANNADPGDLMVCHRCDNPPCCNPDHLWLGTNADNLRDAQRKGRTHIPASVGENNGAARLSAKEAEAIKEMIRAGKTNIYIAAKFNVTHAMISRIRLGKAWGSEPLTDRYSSLHWNTDKVA